MDIYFQDSMKEAVGTGYCYECHMKEVLSHLDDVDHRIRSAAG